jgi:hypothetical protein
MPQNYNFAMDIARSLDKLSPQAEALEKMKIMELLYQVKFGGPAAAQVLPVLTLPAAQVVQSSQTLPAAQPRFL